MDIRECREEDLALLEQHNPSPGQIRRHEERFRRQQLGASTLLTAWIDRVPVGSGEIRWTGCAASEVRERYPDCPEINGLAVWPLERQSSGIGTAIITAAENMAAAPGFRHIGLGVDDGNPRAAALYIRLGYRDVGCRYVDRYYEIDNDGVRHDIAGECRFLVKPLFRTAN